MIQWELLAQQSLILVNLEVKFENNIVEESLYSQLKLTLGTMLDFTVVTTEIIGLV